MSLELIRSLGDIAGLPQEYTVLEMRWLTEPTSTSSPKSSPTSSVETSAQILSLLSHDPKLTSPGIAQRLGATTRAVEKQLAKLKTQNRLHRIGPNKGGHWEVISSNNSL